MFVGKITVSSKFNSEFNPENGCLKDDPFLVGRYLFRSHVKIWECISLFHVSYGFL